MVQDIKHSPEEIKSMALFAKYNPAPVFRFDKNGNILQSNFAANEMFSEVIAKNGRAYEMIKGIDQGKVEKCIRDGDILSLVENVNDKNFRFELRGIPELGAMQVYGADITEIVNAQFENEKLSTAVSQTSNSVMITDSNGNIEFINGAFETKSGYKREDVIGKNPRILKTNYQSKETYKQMWETISSGNVWKGEFHNRRKDGSTYWEEATISPIKDRHGVIQNYIAVKEDITERKKVAEKLHSMALFAELNPEPVMRFADNGLILQSNKAANDIFNEETLIGLEIQDLIKETSNIDFIDFIKKNKIQAIDIQLGVNYYRFILKGINEINVCQMYGSDITDRIEAQKEAMTVVDKDQALRYWATSHGSVYVPASETTPPSEYLSHMAERDLTTPGGKQLTMMTPAYILRQVMSQYATLYSVKGHITSLNVLNPVNEPDEWEIKALQEFNNGKEEVMGVTVIDGNQFLRFMKPMYTKVGCLKCHAEQGFKEGDILGGVSVSTPLAPYLEIEAI